MAEIYVDRAQRHFSNGFYLRLIGQLIQMAYVGKRQSNQ